MENDPTLLHEKSCVVWSKRRERNVTVRVYYYVLEEDGCEIYALQQMQERE